MTKTTALREKINIFAGLDYMCLKCLHHDLLEANPNDLVGPCRGIAYRITNTLSMS
jgi:hypothetical protein